MKILVTGGAGFIGSHIVDAYIKDGHQVLIIDNLSTGRQDNINPEARFFEVDICSDEARQIVEKERPDILNHHAAQVDLRKSISDPLKDIKTDVAGFVGLMEASQKAGVKKIIYASTGGAIYGEQDEFPASELHPERPLSPYGINKLTGEKYLYYYHKQYGISYVALRYANVYGPRQSPLGEAGVVSVFTNRMLSGKQPIINGDGKQTRDYVFVHDVASANLLALQDAAFGAYNVGTSIETDVVTLFKMLKKLTGSDCDEVYGPANPGEQLRSSISAAKITKELGWKITTSLEEGLKKTIEWFGTNVQRG